MEGERRDEDAGRGQLGQEFGSERTSGARHFGAAGLERIRGLVSVERPGPGDVAVADRAAVPPQILLERRRKVEARQPEAVAAGVTGQQGCAPAGRQLQLVAGARVAEGRLAAAEFDHPVAGWAVRRRSGETQLERRPVPPLDRHGRREGGGGVDDEQVAGRKEVRQLVEAGVHDPPAAAARDHQTYLVARQTARLGRLVRLEPAWPLEPVRGHVSSPDAALRAASGDCPRPWPERPWPNCAESVTIAPRRALTRVPPQARRWGR